MTRRGQFHKVLSGHFSQSIPFVVLQLLGAAFECIFANIEDHHKSDVDLSDCSHGANNYKSVVNRPN